MIRIIIPLLLITFTAAGQVNKTTTNKKNIAVAASKKMLIRAPSDSFSYAIGLNVASNLKEQGVDMINSNLIARAIYDVYTDNETAVDMETANRIVQQTFTEISTRKLNEEKLAGLNFLSGNKKNPNVKTTASGLQYEILTPGAGLIPNDTSIVKIVFTGALINGKKIDNSAEQPKPVEFRVNEVIPGWAEALKMMPVGSKWKLFIPFYLAYNDKAVPPAIAAGASLIYEMELLAILN